MTCIPGGAVLTCTPVLGLNIMTVVIETPMMMKTVITVIQHAMQVILPGEVCLRCGCVLTGKSSGSYPLVSVLLTIGSSYVFGCVGG